MSQRFGFLTGSRFLRQCSLAMALCCVTAEISVAQAKEAQLARGLEAVLQYRHFWMGDTTALDLCSSTASTRGVDSAIAERWRKAVRVADCEHRPAGKRPRERVWLRSITMADTVGSAELQVMRGEYSHLERYSLRPRGKIWVVIEVVLNGGLQVHPSAH